MRRIKMITAICSLFIAANALASEGIVDKVTSGGVDTDKRMAPLNNFRKELGGGKFDEGKKVIQTQDGGYLVAGRSVGSTGQTDVSLWKLSTSGDLQWDYKFGESETEEVGDLIELEDGSIIVMGSSDSYGGGVDMKDMWLLKVSASGQQQWVQSYGTDTTIDEGNAVVVADDGGFVLLGRSFDITKENPKSNVMIVKTDDKGMIQWEKKYGGDQNDEGVGILKTEGGYVLASNTESYSKGKWDVMLMGIDLEGNKVWEKSFGGGDTDKANDIIQTADGGFLVAGYSYTFAEASLDAWVIRTDAQGEQQWHKSFGGLSTDEAHAVIKTSDDQYVLAGYTEEWKPDEYGDNTSLNGLNIYMVKFNDSGNKAWERSFGGLGDQRAFDLVESKDKGIVVVGSSKSGEKNEYSILVMKVGENGLQ
ncbi:hypothetical protein V6R21_22200 [Limibacter armeniacum]|uniref:hypothetical protein n=1 Tax=Limibacter armeniacum TaxID=466084 RepID=UPI002FE652AE